jgi:flagellar biosynthesis protein FlhF
LQALADAPGAQSFQNFLVLPATDSRSALSKQAGAFAGIDLAGAVVTKLDETLAVADTFEHILDEALPVAFLSDGQDVSENLHRASKDTFADLLLTGRIS